MNDEPTGKTSAPEPGTDWERLRRMDAPEIRAGIDATPDARATDEAFWKDARVAWPQRKETVTIRLDADLLAWLRRERGYQTRINAILRTYMNAHAGEADSREPRP
jgi:uncharacterized protein (DUF4415 family)